MVAWALNGCKEGKKVVDFAQWVATEVLLQQLAFFGRSLNKQDEENRHIRESGEKEMYKSKNMKLLSELPTDFTKSDLMQLRRKHGMEGGCRYIITRWIKVGLVEQQGYKFKKIKKQTPQTEKAE